MLTLCKIVGLGSPYWYRCCMIFNEVEERRLSSLNGSSRGKTEAFEYNSEIPRVSVPQQCRGNVFRSNQPVCRSCNRPVEVVYRNTLIPVWFGHFWLATIWTTCLNQFLDNVEQISSTMSRKFPRQLWGNIFRNSSTTSRKCFSQFLDNVEQISLTMSRKFLRQLRGNVFRNSWTMSKKFFRSNQPVCRSCNRPVEVVYRNTLIPVWFGHCRGID